MKKCRQTIVLSILCLLACLSFTSNSFAELEFKGNVGVAFNNMACFRGVDTMPGTDFQSVGIAGIKMKGAGPGTFNFGVLGKYGYDLGMDKGLKNKRNDITTSYTLPLFDKKLSLTLGNIAYVFSKSTADNINEAFVSAKVNVLLDPTVVVYYDYETDNDGLFMTAQVSKAFKLAEGLKLKLGALASYNDESSVKIAPYSDLHHAEGTAALNWAATKQLSIVPNILVSTPLSDDAEDIAGLDDEFRYGIKLAVSF